MHPEDINAQQRNQLNWDAREVMDTYDVSFPTGVSNDNHQWYEVHANGVGRLGYVSVPDIPPIGSGRVGSYAPGDLQQSMRELMYLGDNTLEAIASSHQVYMDDCAQLCQGTPFAIRAALPARESADHIYAYFIEETRPSGLLEFLGVQEPELPEPYALAPIPDHQFITGRTPSELYRRGDIYRALRDLTHGFLSVQLEGLEEQRKAQGVKPYSLRGKHPPLDSFLHQMGEILGARFTFDFFAAPYLRSEN